MRTHRQDASRLSDERKRHDPFRRHEALGLYFHAGKQFSQLGSASGGAAVAPAADQSQSRPDPNESSSFVAVAENPTQLLRATPLRLQQPRQLPVQRRGKGTGRRERSCLNIPQEPIGPGPNGLQQEREKGGIPDGCEDKILRPQQEQQRHIAAHRHVADRGNRIRHSHALPQQELFNGTEVPRILVKPDRYGPVATCCDVPRWRDGPIGAARQQALAIHVEIGKPRLNSGHEFSAKSVGERNQLRRRRRTAGRLQQQDAVAGEHIRSALSDRFDVRQVPHVVSDRNASSELIDRAYSVKAVFQAEPGCLGATYQPQYQPPLCFCHASRRQGKTPIALQARAHKQAVRRGDGEIA